MELAVYITKNTDAKVAELLSVPIRTVRSWRRLERSPNPMQSLRIVEKTEGVVDWEGIYRPYARYRARLAGNNVR